MTSTTAGDVGVVVTFRNRIPRALRNLQRTLAAQTHLPHAMAVVDFGDPHPEFERVDLPFHYAYRHLPQPAEWNLGLAMNQGVNLLPPVETILFVDSDMLLAPNFIEVGLRKLKPGHFLNCLIMNLPEDAINDETDVVAEFERLRKLSTPRPEITALGACQWVYKRAWLALRGRDEAFRLQCFEDMDFQRRARWLGLRPIRLEDETTFLHQWHRSKDQVFEDPNDPEHRLAREWYAKNLRRFRQRGILWDVGQIEPDSVNPGGFGKLN